MSIQKLKYIRQLIDELIKETETKIDSVGMSQSEPVCEHKNTIDCVGLCISDYHQAHCVDCGKHLILTIF